LLTSRVTARPHASNSRKSTKGASLLDRHKNASLLSRHLHTPGKNVKHYIAGALNCRTGRVLYSDGPSKNSDLFIALLDKLHHSYRRPQVIHLILDNYVIHKSRKTLEALEKLGPRIQLHFLPPYSPEHNVIERLWKQMHDNVTRNHRHKTMAQLLENVHVFLQNAQPFPGTKFSTQRRVA
jgi:transposase